MRVLLVQSDMRSTQPLVRFFKQRGDEIWQAWELGQAAGMLEQVKPELMLMDLHFPNQEWQTFLRNARAQNPGLDVIITNKYPDLQREMVARENGVQVFLRQPFSARWIEQALARLAESTQPVRRREVEKPATGTVRMPMRIKITLPYLLLALLFALAAAYVLSQVVLESVQDRFLNQLVATARQASDWMVREEDRLLESLRLVANSQGVANAMQSGNAETLRTLVLPIAVNAGEEELHLLDMQGVSVLSLFHTAGGGPADYQASRGSIALQGQDWVKRVLDGEVDAAGDKYAGIATGASGESTFYVSGPVFDSAGVQTGVVIVGKSLRTLARQMHEETLGYVSLYGLDGKPLSSTIYTPTESYPVTLADVLQVVSEQDQSSRVREITLSGVAYSEILGPWEVRTGADLGVMGVALTQAFLVQTSQGTQTEIFVIVALAILLVVSVGLLLANLITRPLMRLVAASSEVAQGNLEVKVEAAGDDEVAVLAQSFNFMVAGLQEGSIYRDLLGRTVSPEVREQLRQTFTTGGLRLEGQEAVATVLLSDIRGFTTFSEQADPATVFQWLNEYFGQLVPVVTTHGGVVNKFDGDAMLAFFGTLPRPLDPKQSALAACQTAVEMLRLINQLNAARRQRGEPEFVTGIGVNTGVLIAGGLGTSDRLHYTIIGDTVNTTSRLESLTRDLMDSSGILISQATYEALEEFRSSFRCIPLGMHRVKGKQDELLVYRLEPWDLSRPAPKVDP